MTKRIGILLVILFAYLFGSGLVRAQDHPACGPLSQNHDLWVEAMEADIGAWNPSFRELFERVRQRLYEYPEDVSLSEAYERLIRDLGPEMRVSFISWTTQQARLRSESAAAQVIAALSIPKASEAALYTSRALAINPDYPPARLRALALLAYAPDQANAVALLGSVEQHVEALRRLCPSYPSVWLRYERLLNDRYFAAHPLPANIRQIIWENELPRSQRQAMQALAFVHSIEGRTLMTMRARALLEKDFDRLQKLPSSLPTLDLMWA